MKYLLQMTRSTRADRPAEAEIVADSAALDEHRWGEVVQDLTEDNFFILSADSNNLELILIKLLAGMPWTPAKILEDEGYAVTPYQHSNRWTLASALRPGSTAQVQYFAENSDGSESFNTLAEAQVYIASLNNADGWTLIDEGETTQVISSTPPLWKSYARAVLTQPNFLPTRQNEPDRV